MSVVPLKINFDGPEADRMAISQCAKFVRRRIADTQAAEAWIVCGEKLAGLKDNLKKTTPKGDNARIGWLQAFELMPKEFPFGRRHADKLIEIHNFFNGPAWPLKKLPASFKALHALVYYKFNSKLIEQCIMDESISPGSTITEVTTLAQRLRLDRKAKQADPKTAPKSKRVAKVRALMKRLGVSLGDLNNG